jgi:phosphoribosyl-AMP cyclohydrolase
LSDNWLNKINWSADGLVPAIAQDAESGRVLMVAWMDRDALQRTVALGEAVYWSRSRHVQRVKEIRLDCDQDVLLLQIEQYGGIACHTGRESCFFSRLEHGQWVETDAVLKSPEDIYQKKSTSDD